jgi:hypothetical protein
MTLAVRDRVKRIMNLNVYRESEHAFLCVHGHEYELKHEH